MNILMLNSFDEWGGAARAALRLKEGIKELGVDTRLLVNFKDGNDMDVSGPKSGLARIANGIRSHLDSIPTLFYPNKPRYNFTPAYIPDRLTAKVFRIGADILHLHWMGGGFCRLETLAEFKKPILWTLHDSWAFTGGCHVPFDCKSYRLKCGACPVLGSTKKNDLSRRVWERKSKAWRNLNLTVVSPSHWLATCAGLSSLFKDIRIEVIPNGLDLSLFKPVNKNYARKQLGLHQDRKYILFGGINSTGDKNKGFHLLVPALRKLVNDGLLDSTELIIFGSSESSSVPQLEGMKAHYLGRLHDDKAIVLFYSAADLFIAPSMLENLPNTVMEAMACGTPCVAFEQGGMTDLIEHENTGYLAQAYESDDLSRGIDRILKNNETRLAMAERSRQKAMEHFDITKVSKQYVSLYGEMSGENRSGK
jgi:glycosyltransferase involved in cell wall biosynthesis